MMDLPFTPPAFNAKSFNCPRAECRAYAKQSWDDLFKLDAFGTRTAYEEIRLAHCSHCRKDSVWLRGKLIDPAGRTTPLPNPDLSPEIQKDFNEAAHIEHQSPRGAAALLRLCVQRLCQQLGQKGDNINNDIKAFVRSGLPVGIQQALDIVRVIGNNSVHPGEINLDDTPETVGALFVLINAIADQMITHPKKIEELYGALPPGVLSAIKKRDTPKP